MAAGAADVVAPDALILDTEAVDLLVLRHAPQLYDDRALERMLIERLARERAALQARRPADASPVGLPWGQFFADPSAGITPEGRAALLPAFRAWSEARAVALPDALVLVESRSSRTQPAHDCGSPFGRNEPIGHPGEALVNDVLGTGVWEEFIAAMLRRRSYDMSLTEYPVLHFLPGGLTRNVQGSPQRCPAAGTLIARDRAGPTGFVTGFDIASAPQADLILIGDNALRTLGRGLATFYYLRDVRLAVHPVGPPGSPVVATVIMGASTDRVVDLRAPAMATLPPTEDELWSRARADAARGVAPTAQDILGLTLGISRSAFEEFALGHLSQPIAGVVLPREDARHVGETHGFMDTETGETLVAVFPAGASDGPVIALGRRVLLPAGTDTTAIMADVVEKYGAPGDEVPTEREPRFTTGFPEDHLDLNMLCGQMTERGGGFGSEAFDAPVPSDVTNRFGRELLRGMGALDDQALGRLVDANPNQSPPATCGPSVIASINTYATPQGRMLQLKIWLVDMAAAAVAVRAAREAAPAAPRIRL